MNAVKTLVLALAVFAGFFQSTSFATDVPNEVRDHFVYETVRLPGSPFRVSFGDFYSLYLEGRPRYIKTMWVKAETHGADATLEVIANGTVLGRIRADGYEAPATMINVRDHVTSLEFRHINGAPVYVTEIIAVRSISTSEDWKAIDRQFDANNSSLIALNSASQLAKRAIELVERLRPFVDPRTDYIDYLLPIKTTAGTAFAVAQAYGDNLSMQTRQAMKDLSFSIGQAQRVLTDLMHVESCFDLAVEMRALKHEIDRRLI